MHTTRTILGLGRGQRARDLSGPQIRLRLDYIGTWRGTWGEGPLYTPDSPLSIGDAFLDDERLGIKSLTLDCKIYGYGFETGREIEHQSSNREKTGAKKFRVKKDMYVPQIVNGEKYRDC